MLDEQSPPTFFGAAAAPPPAPPEEEDESDLRTRLVEGAQRVARRPETKFGAGGFLLGALAAVAFLGATLQPAGVQDARDDARLAIEKLAIVQARLDAMDGGEVAARPADHAANEPAAAEHEAEATEAKAESHGGESAEPALPHWSYSGDDGPAKWGSLAHEYAACASGKEQSPIDLAKGQIEGAMDLEFHYASSEASVTDNGHTLQVDLPAGGYLLVGERRFDLVQFHFHGPSEHTVGGRSYPLELHLVHKDEAGKLAVVGVLVEAGSANSIVGSVLEALPTTQNRTEPVGKTLNPERLLPTFKSSFQYSGSLTTPPCTESVAWSVLVAPITMSQEQIDMLRARFHGGNNRPIQPIGGRTLFVDFSAAP